MIPLLLLLALQAQASEAQLAGCASPEIDCSTKTISKDPQQHDICDKDYSQYGLGIVSFDSNITADGPLTWTLSSPLFYDDLESTTINKHLLLGTPPSVDFHHITNFGGCAIAVGGYDLKYNMAVNLQTANDYDDFDHFGCPTVLGSLCPRALEITIQQALTSILTSNFTLGEEWSTCNAIASQLTGLELPESCREQFGRDTLAFDGNIDPAADLMGTGMGHPLHPEPVLHSNNCTISTGGSNYNFVGGPIVAGESNSRLDELSISFINGTTPILTTFFNKPWNRTLKPAPFLSLPEVHLSCVKLRQTEEEVQRLLKSGSAQIHTSTPILATLLIASAIWLML